LIWTMELASFLDDAPWPATKEELVDFALRTGAPVEVVENLQELEDSEEPYESMEEIWPDYPTGRRFLLRGRGGVLSVMAPSARSLMAPSARSLILCRELCSLPTQPVRLGFFVIVAGHLKSDTTRAPS